MVNDHEQDGAASTAKSRTVKGCRWTQKRHELVQPS